MSEPDPVWELFEILDQRVKLSDQAERVMELVLKVCRELARTSDQSLETLLAIGEAAARGAANYEESSAARVRAHALIERLAGNPREQAAIVCVRYALPDGNAYDAYELLWQFLHDAQGAGMSSADLASILADVFPEVR